MQTKDLSESLSDRVRQAFSQKLPLNIKGGGSKSFYGRKAMGEVLDVSGHCGILEYEPTELVITARSGTPLSTIEALLKENRQMLGFEPPHFGITATLGGTIACGFSGPRRPYAGSARDAVLGVKLINGKGEILSFGGQVMKNVAGFDLSRLMAGAMGTLGILLEISLKVLPQPEQEETLCFEMAAERALAAMNQWAGQCWPISAACHDGERLYLRLSGASAAVDSSRRKLGGEPCSGEDFWAGLREQRLPFFQSQSPLWRISLPPASPQLPLAGHCFIDWGGALRWLQNTLLAQVVFEAARQAGGHATLFRSEQGSHFQPLPPELRTLHIKLKKAFDPKGILNPGRLYEEW